MKKTIFTQKDFLNACDSINQINDDKFGIWFDAQNKYSFDNIFINKKEAKEFLYKFVGIEIYGYSVYSLNNSVGF